VRDTLAAAENPESRVRIIVTRGDGTVDLDPAAAGQPRLVVIVQPLGGPSPEVYEKGAEAEIVSVTRNSPASHRSRGQVRQLPQQCAGHG